MIQQETSLQQLRQALDALRQALEGVESALLEFEEEALGGGDEEETQRWQSGTSFQLLSIPEVCQELGMGKSWVHHRLKSGEIPNLRLGNNIKVRRKALEGYLESLRYHPPDEEEEELQREG